MIKKAIISLLLSSSLMAGVTVADATGAYGKLLVSIFLFNASAMILEESQSEINDDLSKQLKSAKALNNATAYNIEQYKILNGVTSSYVGSQAANLKMGLIQNDADILYSKVLEGGLIKDDIRRVAK